MTSLLRRSVPAFLLALIAVVPALADPSKLDPTARIALARLRAGESSQALREEGRLALGPHGELDVFIVGGVSRARLEAAGARVRTALPGVFTAWVPADRIGEVAALGGVIRIEGAQIDRADHNFSVPTTNAHLFRGPGNAFTGLNGAGVIVGNIDTGVDYHHEDFKNPDGSTRILRIWDQTDAIGPSPAGFVYGSECTSVEIDNLTSRARDTQGHGSHTMGSAAGDGSQVAPTSAPAFHYAGMAPRADIMVVDGSVSGGFSRTQMVDGINYLMQQATALGRSIVVNVSIGSQSGPKDGTDPYEQAVDAMSGPGKVVVQSAGNDRGLPLHAEWHPGDPAVTMDIAGTQTTARFVAVRGYYEASEELNITITTPGGTAIGPIPLGGTSGAYPGTATANGNVYVENGVSLTSTGDKLVYIELNAPDTGTMAGTWMYAYTPIVIGAAGGEVDMWRTAFNTTSASFGQGNQPNEEIIGALATGHQTIAAGAWVSKQAWTDCRAAMWDSPNNVFGAPPIGNIATFSSPGPTRDGRIKPDVSGPGIAIASVMTSDVPSSCPGVATTLLHGLKHVINAGTSMSAPHVAGAVALLFQKFGALTPAQVQTLLHSRALADGFVTEFGAVPNKDFGWGKLNLGDLSDPITNVVHPNGGEVLVVGTAEDLRWNASDAYQGVTGVDLHLSRDGGATWETIDLGVSNAGSYPWVVSGPPTSQAILRVTARDAAGNQGADRSDRVFAIDEATAALLTRFRAEPVAEGMRLSWQLHGDPAAAVSVQRAAAAGGPWQEIDPERSREGHMVHALDRDVQPGQTWFYRLLARETGGAETVFGPISGTVGAAIAAFALDPVFPNPSGGRADITFAVPREAQVRVAVFDVQGRHVITLAEGRHAPGRYQARWNGRAAESGLYFVRLETPERSFVGRLVMAP
jgi:subtilisin family serine protease